MDYVFHSKPFRHQELTFRTSKDLASFGILWEQGCGKTKLAIDTACYLWEQGKIDAVLVLAPSGVHRNWLTDELPAHMPTRLRRISQAEFWETKKAGQVGFDHKMKALAAHKGFSWAFMSYNSFMTEKGKKWAWDYLKNRRCFYVLDEAHNIKTPNTKRTKSVVASGKYAAYRRILTGTPIAQGPFDIYSQLKFLDEKFWAPFGFSSFFAFKTYFGEWFTREEARNRMGYDPGYDKLIRFRHLDRLGEILASVSSRVTKESAGLDLPPKIYSRRYYDLNPEQLRLYRALREDYLAQLNEEKTISAETAIVRLLRLQQIICGYVQTDEDEPVHLLSGGNPRLNLLEEIIEETHHPAIIWARFTKDIDQIMGLLGDRAVRYDGKVSSEEAAQNKEKFQKGDAQFFIANQAKGKEGLTLIQAKTVIYYSNSFKLIDRLQSEDRAHRIGQTHSVNYIDIIAPGTIDEHIIQSLRQKFDVATQITKDELKEWL